MSRRGRCSGPMEVKEPKEARAAGREERRLRVGRGLRSPCPKGQQWAGGSPGVHFQKVTLAKAGRSHSATNSVHVFSPEKIQVTGHLEMTPANIFGVFLSSKELI